MAVSPEVTDKWHERIHWGKIAMDASIVAGAAGLALLADDVSGIGIVDDVVALPLLGLSLMLGSVGGNANLGKDKGSCVN